MANSLTSGGLTVGDTVPAVLSGATVSHTLANVIDLGGVDFLCRY